MARNWTMLIPIFWLPIEHPEEVHQSISIYGKLCLNFKQKSKQVGTQR